MVQRCTNPKHPAYAYYGGRGITVCPEWRDFAIFWLAMGECPDGYWMDRIDNSKGYEPGNCRWVTPSESAKNRRPRPKDPDSLKGRCRAAGMPYSLVYQRIRWGWTEERALSVPRRSPGRHPGERMGVPRDQTDRVWQPPIKRQLASY
jgi:hypothetical protein